MVRNVLYISREQEDNTKKSKKEAKERWRCDRRRHGPSKTPDRNMIKEEPPVMPVPWLESLNGKDMIQEQRSCPYWSVAECWGHPPIVRFGSA